MTDGWAFEPRSRLLGLSGAPSAGEPFVVVENESRAREITEFRERRQRDKVGWCRGGGRARHAGSDAGAYPGRRAEGSRRSDQGRRARQCRSASRWWCRSLHTRRSRSACCCPASVRLPRATFSSPRRPVRSLSPSTSAPPRKPATWRTREGVDIRYFSIIYEVARTTSKSWSKARSHRRHERSSWATPRSARCSTLPRPARSRAAYITEGVVKRGAGVRVLRDNVVIHTGELVAAQALQGRCPRGGAWLRMRSFLR